MILINIDMIEKQSKVPNYVSLINSSRQKTKNSIRPSTNLLSE